MEELFCVDVALDGAEEIAGRHGRAVMIRFHGRCDCNFFHGEILPGGVDTQKGLPGVPYALSARYMLSGVDGNGAPARIFIENNGEYDAQGECVTHPLILTDSPALAWLEETPLTGRITGTPQGVMIHFFREESTHDQ